MPLVIQVARLLLRSEMMNLRCNFQFQTNGKGLPESFDISQSESFGLRFIKLLRATVGDI